MSKYEDIIHLPHHQSSTHPHMALEDRAAQFAPFAALKGHNTAIQETARTREKNVTKYKQEIMVEDGEAIPVTEIFEVEPVKKEK